MFKFGSVGYFKLMPIDEDHDIALITGTVNGSRKTLRLYDVFIRSEIKGVEDVSIYEASEGVVVIIKDGDVQPLAVASSWLDITATEPEREVDWEWMPNIWLLDQFAHISH